MDWQQKARAIEALGDIKIGLTYGTPSRWMCSTEKLIEITSGPILKGGAGYGETPEEAIEDFWERLTDLPPGEFLVRNAGRDDRAHFRWNGFMWEPLPIEIPAPKEG